MWVPNKKRRLTAQIVESPVKILYEDQSIIVFVCYNDNDTRKTMAILSII